MATTVDERIVAAKFDASDFEKGVNKTISKLDELKKSLDLKEATKGVKELAEKTEVSTDSMSKSLDKLTERFTTFTGMIKQKILGGLADEVSGVFLRMEQRVVGFIRSISSDQVSAGMQKYEQMLTSVRVMMSAGETEGAAYEAIGQLRDYSDQTSYSLSQMTDALSKLRAAGVDLDTATRSVEGIANACANAGINATEAQRAFFNLSQAYSSGVLKYTDYRSLELLNMTTSEFKNQILEAAVAAGTLEKTSDGVYKTINKNNKKVTAGKKVTEKNLQDMLRYNFVTSDVLNELFGGKYFFDESKWKEYKKKYDTIEEAVAAAKKDFGETAVNAYFAGKEARSFTDVINTLKDVVSTGWSTTFELLFGKLEVAKQFFTDLTEGELADVVYKIGEYRNAVLGFWNGTDDNGGGKVFRDTILDISEALGTLLKTFLQILPGFDELDNAEDEAQPQLQKLGDELYLLSLNIRSATGEMKEAIGRFNEFMNSPIMENGPTRIELIRQTLANIGTVFSIVGKVAGQVFNRLEKAFYTISPIFDGLLQLFEKVTEPIVTLNENTEAFDKIGYSIDNILTVLDPVATVLGKILGFAGDIASFVASMALDTVVSNVTFFADALGLVIELITGNSAQMENGKGVLDGIKNDFEGIKQACSDGIGVLKEFFGTLISDIRNLLGLTTGDENATKETGGIFSGLINFFDTNQFVQDAKAWVNQAIVDVGDFIKSMPERVLKFGANIYDTLRGLFFEDQTRYNGRDLETKTVLTPLGQWADTLINDIRDFIISLPNRIINGIGKIGSWIDDIFNSLFGAGSTEKKDEVTKQDAQKDEKKKSEEAILANFNQFISDVTTSIREWFDDLPNKIRSGMKGVGNFFTRVFQSINEFLFGRNVTEVVKDVSPQGPKKSYKKITTNYKTGFSKWLDGVITEIKKFVANIPNYIKAGIKGAGDVMTSIVNALFGVPDNGKEVTNKDIEKKIEKPFLGIDLTHVLTTIKDIGRTLLNQIARIFTGSEDIEENQQWFANKIAEGINWIRTKAEEIFPKVTEFIGSIPSRIAGLFIGETEETKKDDSPIGAAISGFGAAVGKFITEDLPAAILKFIDDAVAIIGDLWGRLYRAIVGESEEKAEEASEEAVQAVDAAAAAEPEVTGWQKFVQRLGETISNVFTQLPVWISQGVEMAIAGIQGLFGSITDWFADHNVAEEAKKLTEEFKEGTTEIASGAQEAAEETEGKENPLWTSVKNIGLSIFTLITETVPAMISEAWTWISTKATEIWDGIGKIFSGQDIPEGEKTEATDSIVSKIKTFITETVPQKVSEVWEAIKNFAADVWTGLHYMFTGEIPENERSQSVKNIVDAIKKFIMQDVPNAISGVWNDVFGGGTEAYKKSIPGVQAMHTALVDVITDEQYRANKKLEEESSKPGIWTFFESLKDSLVKAFSDVGPSILNALATALDWLGNVANIIVDALTGEKSIGEQVEEAYGEEKPELREAFERIGESLKTFFLETLPKFIGAAIGSLVKNASKWFGNLYDGLSKSANKEGAKTAGEMSDAISDPVAVAAESGINEVMATMTDLTGENDEAINTGGIFDGIKGIIDAISNIATSDITQAIVILALVSVIVSRLAGLFSVSEVIDSLSDTIKWAAILVAVGSIATIMSAIISLVKEGTPEQIQRAQDILTSLGEFCEKLKSIAIVVAVVKGLGVLGDIFDLFGDDSDDEKGAKKNVEKLSFKEKVFGKLGDAVGNLVSGIPDMLGGFLKDLGRSFGAAAGVTVVGKAVNATVDETISTLTSSLLNMTSGVGDMFTFITPLVTTMVDLNSKMDDAISAAGKLGTLYAELFKAFANLYADSSGNTQIGNYGNIGFDVQTSTFMYKEDLEKRLDFAVKLADFIESMAAAFDSIGFAQDQSRIETFRVFVGSVVDILGSLAESITTQQATQEAVSKVVSGDKTLAAFGNQIKLFGTHMKAFFNSVVDIKGFKSNEVKETQDKIKAMIDIAQGMAQASILLDGIGVSKFDEFGQKAASLGWNIGTLFNNFNRATSGTEQFAAIDTERMQMLALSANAISNILYSLKQAFGDGYQFSSLIDTFYNQMGGNGGDTNYYNKLAASLRLFGNAVADSFDNTESLEKYKSSGGSIAQKLSEGIQEAFDNPELGLQPTITPVLNLDAAKQQLIDFFGTGSIDTFNFGEVMRSAMAAGTQIDTDRVSQTWLEQQLVGLTNAIAAGPTNAVSISDVTSAFAHMKIITNTGALVGEISDAIDDTIGHKIWMITRTVTP